MVDLATVIADFGGDPAGLRLLDGDSPDLLPYATLLTAQRSGSDLLASVSAIYEWQGAPLLFLVDGDTLLQRCPEPPHRVDHQTDRNRRRDG